MARDSGLELSASRTTQDSLNEGLKSFRVDDGTDLDHAATHEEKHVDDPREEYNDYKGKEEKKLDHLLKGEADVVEVMMDSVEQEMNERLSLLVRTEDTFDLNATMEVDDVANLRESKLFYGHQKSVYESLYGCDLALEELQHELEDANFSWRNNVESDGYEDEREDDVLFLGKSQEDGEDGRGTVLGVTNDSQKEESVAVGQEKKMVIFVVSEDQQLLKPEANDGGVTDLKAQTIHTLEHELEDGSALAGQLKAEEKEAHRRSLLATGGSSSSRTKVSDMFLLTHDDIVLDDEATMMASSEDSTMMLPAKRKNVEDKNKEELCIVSEASREAKELEYEFGDRMARNELLLMEDVVVDRESVVFYAHNKSVYNSLYDDQGLAELQLELESAEEFILSMVSPKTAERGSDDDKDATTEGELVLDDQLQEPLSATTAALKEEVTKLLPLSEQERKQQQRRLLKQEMIFEAAARSAREGKVRAGLERLAAIRRSQIMEQVQQDYEQEEHLPLEEEEKRLQDIVEAHVPRKVAAAGEAAGSDQECFVRETSEAKVVAFEEAAHKARLEMESVELEAKEQHLAEEVAEEARLEMEEMEHINQEMIKAEARRLANHKAEAARLAVEAAEKARLEQERIKQENIEVEARRLANEEAEAARLAEEATEKVRLEQERIKQENIEAEAWRLAIEKAEAAHLAEEAAEKGGLAQKSIKQGKIEAEAWRLANEKAEAARLAQEQRLAHEAAEKARLEEEHIKQEKMDAEAKRLTNEKAEAARLAEEAAGKARLEQERIKQEKVECRAAAEAEAKGVANEKAGAAYLAEESARAEAKRLVEDEAEATKLANQKEEAACLAEEAAEEARLKQEGIKQEKIVAEVTGSPKEQRSAGEVCNKQEKVEAEARTAEAETARSTRGKAEVVCLSGEAAGKTRLEQERIKQTEIEAVAKRLAVETEGGKLEQERLEQHKLAAEAADVARVELEGQFEQKRIEQEILELDKLAAAEARIKHDQSEQEPEAAEAVATPPKRIIHLERAKSAPFAEDKRLAKEAAAARFRMACKIVAASPPSQIVPLERTKSACFAENKRLAVEAAAAHFTMILRTEKENLAAQVAEVARIETDRQESEQSQLLANENIGQKVVGKRKECDIDTESSSTTRVMGTSSSMGPEEPINIGSAPAGAELLNGSDRTSCRGQSLAKERRFTHLPEEYHSTVLEDENYSEDMSPSINLPSQGDRRGSVSASVHDTLHRAEQDLGLQLEFLKQRSGAITPAMSCDNSMLTLSTDEYALDVLRRDLLQAEVELNRIHAEEEAAASKAREDDEGTSVANSDRTLTFQQDLSQAIPEEGEDKSLLCDAELMEQMRAAETKEMAVENVEEFLHDDYLTVPATPRTGPNQAESFSPFSLLDLAAFNVSIPRFSKTVGGPKSIEAPRRCLPVTISAVSTTISETEVVEEEGNSSSFDFRLNHRSSSRNRTPFVIVAVLVVDLAFLVSIYLQSFIQFQINPGGLVSMPAGNLVVEPVMTCDSDATNIRNSARSGSGQEQPTKPEANPEEIYEEFTPIPLPLEDRIYAEFTPAGQPVMTCALDATDLCSSARSGSGQEQPTTPEADREGVYDEFTPIVLPLGERLYVEFTPAGKVLLGPVMTCDLDSTEICSSARSGSGQEQPRLDANPEGMYEEFTPIPLLLEDRIYAEFTPAGDIVVEPVITYDFVATDICSSARSGGGQEQRRRPEADPEGMYEEFTPIPLPLGEDIHPEFTPMPLPWAPKLKGIAQEFGCDVEDGMEVVECLRKIERSRYYTKRWKRIHRRSMNG